MAVLDDSGNHQHSRMVGAHVLIEISQPTSQDGIVASMDVVDKRFDTNGAQ